MPAVQKKANPEEACIARAIEALCSGEQKSVRAAHKAFNLLYKKLLGRYQHRTEASHSRQNKALDKAQEDALLQYIDRYSEGGRLAKRQYIINVVNSIL